MSGVNTLTSDSVGGSCVKRAGIPEGVPIKRFYFPQSTQADVEPIDNAVWQFPVGGWSHRHLTISKTNTANAAGLARTINFPGQYYGDRRYTSDALSGQTISGAVKMQLMAVQGIGPAVYGAYEIYVVNNAGDTVRGGLLVQGNRATSLALLYTNHIWVPAGTALSALSVQAGDRLVVSIGYIISGDGLGNTGAAIYGDPIAGVDFSEDDADVDNSKVPWIEFSNSIYMQ